MAKKNREMNAIVAEKLFIAVYVLLALITVVVFIFGRQFLASKHDTLLEVQASVAANDAQLDDTRKAKKWLEDESRISLVKKLDSSIGSSDYQIAVYDDLLTYAQIAGVEVTGLTFPAQTTPGVVTPGSTTTPGATPAISTPPGMTPISVGLTFGSVRYLNYLAFLKLLENSPTPYLVNDITLSTDQTDTEKLNLQTTVITTYIRQ
jgi:hypothetical protein